MLSGWRLTLSKFFLIPQRLLTTIMCFLAIMISYTMRTALSFAITKMVVKHSGDESEQECQDDDFLPIPDGESTGGGDGTFDWNEELQGLILASFYIGYIFTHMPGGVIASKYGGKYTIIVGLSISTFFTLLTPICVMSGGATALIILRVIIGLGDGVIFPSCSALLASWVPLKERSKMGTLTFTGVQIGSIFGSLVSGALLDAIDGWDSVFYFFGSLGMIWIVIFSLICYNGPNEHPFISDKEREYLTNELKENGRSDVRGPIPFRAIFTSPPLIAMVIAQLGHNYGFFVIVTDLPKYMNDVLKFSLTQNGFYTALPYICMWCVAQITAYFSDLIIAKKLLSITNVRKLWTTTSALGSGIFLLAASYAECNRTLVVIFFTIGVGFMGTFVSGSKCNNLDIAPNYAGVLMAITNGVGGISGIVSPYIVGVLTPNSLMNEWRLVFWITFGVGIGAVIIYDIWASGEIQKWNNPDELELIKNGQITLETNNNNNNDIENKITNQ